MNAMSFIHKWKLVSLGLLMSLGTGRGLAQTSVEITPGLVTAINGEIRVELNGNWLNQGSLIPGNSMFVLRGGHPQTLRQDQGAFYALVVNKAMGEISLAGDIHIKEDSLKVISGHIDLNSWHIGLDSTATLSEMPRNTVMGSAGYISTTRSINSPNAENVAGMGLVIKSSNNFGTTELRRGHAPQSANGVMGINRYFDIFPQAVGSSPDSVVFRYDDSELNGNLEAALVMYASKDTGTTWTEINGTLDTGSNSFATVITDNYQRFTLSSNSLVDLPELNVGLTDGPCGVLLENFPNPFSAGTEIRFKLPQRGMVQLAVFDAQGRLVEQLISDEYGHGWHSVRFDGSRHADGLYLIYIKTQCTTVTRLAVLNKN